MFRRDSESGQSTLEATLSSSALRSMVGGAGKAWRVRVERGTTDMWRTFSHKLSSLSFVLSMLKDRICILDHSGYRATNVTFCVSRYSKLFCDQSGLFLYFVCVLWILNFKIYIHSTSYCYLYFTLREKNLYIISMNLSIWLYKFTVPSLHLQNFKALEL